MNKGWGFTLLLVVVGITLMLTYPHWAPGVDAMFGVHHPCAP